MQTSKWINLSGKQVYYEEHKSEKNAPPFSFVLIHGFLASTFSFRRIIPLLRQKYNIYALDLVGFGKSEKTKKFTYSYESYAAVVLEFIKKLGLKNVVIVGHSMGGQIALHAVRKPPGAIKCVILAGCSGYLRKTNRWFVYCSYFPFVRLGLKWWIVRQKVEKILQNTVYDLSIIDKDMTDAYSMPIQEEKFCDTLIGLFRQRGEDLTSEDLKAVHHPVLLIWGEEDRIVPLRKGIRLRQDLPSSTFVSLPDAGHQVLEEKPGEAYAEIEKWLAIQKSCFV